MGEFNLIESVSENQHDSNRNVFSDVQFDAFISYKSGEIDDAVAEQLQKKLERYRVPGDKKKKRIRRVFVDRNELAATSDLSRDIKEALKNSTWLIVICSQETKKSNWVMREIRTFVESHDNKVDHVLALVTGGELENVIPESLISDSTCRPVDKVKAADARGENKKQVLKQLNKKAFYEIAAPLFETDLDSLIQRQKRYTIQKIISITVITAIAATCFSIFALKQWKNYNELQNFSTRMERQLKIEHLKTPYLGVVVSENEFLNKYGLYVESVDEDGAFYDDELGYYIQKGYYIYTINGEKVTSISQLRDILKALGTGAGITVGGSTSSRKSYSCRVTLGQRRYIASNHF